MYSPATYYSYVHYTGFLWYVNPHASEHLKTEPACPRVREKTPRTVALSVRTTVRVMVLPRIVPDSVLAAGRCPHRSGPVRHAPACAGRLPRRCHPGTSSHSRWFRRRSHTPIGATCGSATDGCWPPQGRDVIVAARWEWTAVITAEGSSGHLSSQPLYGLSDAYCFLSAGARRPALGCYRPEEEQRKRARAAITGRVVQEGQRHPSGEGRHIVRRCPFRTESVQSRRRDDPRQWECRGGCEESRLWQ